MQAAAHTTPVQFVPRTAIAARGAAPLATNCSACHLKELCLPCGLPGEDVERLDQLRFARRRVKQGEALYQAGEKFGSIHAVRSGTFKTVLTLRDGRQQVTGFHMAGEMMGMDGLATGRHASAAEALEDCEVCVVPYAHLTQLAASNSSLQHVVGRLMSREIVREHSLMLLLGSMNAEERLAAFLVNISQRLQARGYSATEFHLRMMRSEIGSYLGLKLETVSRTFSLFQSMGLLAVDKKHVRILDMERLSSTIEARVH
ncbi:fumarate/nitrate reduction transcriptional regulator Fnr [Ramlibacter albus]|uniref:Fumarate/nitrate reduction transcriptional regulator Fnr n=1 Tax=Ramlibacter albus TaxID=2079448 RepID=A0A923M7E7_9BURK|nr:fumarate/nitrate reduction transcriptional regulator Fnr [Ramlibacter albus]MBC5765627.1 fumarate/nitrate reduction transcriptional regulator Fnr [Ramlibacter albus]